MQTSMPAAGTALRGRLICGILKTAMYSLLAPDFLTTGIESKVKGRVPRGKGIEAGGGGSAMVGQGADRVMQICAPSAFATATVRAVKQTLLPLTVYTGSTRKRDCAVSRTQP
ncbi:hypothetical protein TSOC_004159 [Tetrabaena socialis]|uniref:Uncharacterized protein n=1 Tax=Tetrabaena socialis TaxID=47790 RepID=A0A2J8A9N1_9CHLO|nr:hypothetical protein TSOC_004159 [Tetrabaena socialis]|eukprot:PNH09238.1 hypothetical protein TSOC_004159 [Tetrabaena socialis]